MLQAVLGIVGILIVIWGLYTRREASWGKWIIVLGIVIIVSSVVIEGWADIKSGFVDALLER